jgi:glycosyltransferase involved in cell wall biosynthesis
MTKISVVIPYYNQPEFIEKALESIYAQTTLPFEIIVVDDGSDLPLQITLKDKSVKVVRVNKNSGIAVARNVGVKAATGDWIAFLSADDLWEPDFLEVAMKERGDADVVYSDYYIIDADGKMLNVFKEYDAQNQVDLTIHAWQRCCVMFSAILINKNVFKQVMFDDDLRFGEDYLFLLKTLKLFEYKHIAKPLARYRKHPKQTTNIKLINIPNNDKEIRRRAEEFYENNS